MKKTKKCKQCGKRKSIDKYYKHKTCKDGYRDICKICINKLSKEYVEKNKEKIAQRQKKYREKNKEKLSQQRKDYREKNKEKVKKQKQANYLKHKNKTLQKSKEYKEKLKKENPEKLKLWRKNYCIRHKNKLKEYKRNYHQKNKVKIRNIRNKYRKYKYDSDIGYRMQENIRSRMRYLLKGYYKSKATLELLGCSDDQLKKHLEKQFEPSMTWDNYGYYGWHIDHIRPCSSFDLSDLEQQKQCFHYTNLQPLWAKDNYIKGNKIPISSSDDLHGLPLNTHTE
jgi:hypothetical protein